MCALSQPLAGRPPTLDHSQPPATHLELCIKLLARLVLTCAVEHVLVQEEVVVVDEGRVEPKVEHLVLPNLRAEGKGEGVEWEDRAC